LINVFDDGPGRSIARGEERPVARTDSPPRTIWTLWRQGYERAPPLVRACLESWRRLNPGWRLMALDEQSIRAWVDLDAIIDPKRTDVTVQKWSAIARLCLLRRYGGAWADATLYCLRPLDEWLPGPLGGGFFAFRDPGPDRLASNWFMASDPNDPILVALHDAFIGQWSRVRFSNQDTVFGRWALARLSPLLNTTPARSVLWTNPVLQSLLRIYPYFIFHYTFNALILNNAGLRWQWESAKPLSAVPPHRAQTCATRPGGYETFVAELEAGNVGPLQKLDWRVDVESEYWRGVLEALAKRASARGASNS
jgi:hypothetical protein